MFFVLECGNQAKLAVFHGKLQQTEWMPVEALSVQLTGLNLDTAWGNIIL